MSEPQHSARVEQLLAWGRETAVRVAYRTFVPGTPAPQGSKRYVGNGINIESSKKVKPWRADIREHFLACYDQPPMTGAVAVQLEFVMPRPASAPKRSTPPAIKRPDLDKLARAVLDAIGSAGAWTDDARVTDLHARKRLAEIGEVPGVHIVVSDLSSPLLDPASPAQE